MSKQAQTAADVRNNLAENLDWRFAERNDTQVARAMYQGEPVDAVHTLDEAGLLDGFFQFLRELHILEHWETFTITKVYRVFVPAIYFVLLYGTRVLFGITSTNALPELLFSDVAVMALIGFNAHLVEHGMTHRGEQQRTGERPYVLMDPQTLASTVCKASAEALADLFNGTIRLLAAAQVFPALVMAAGDGTQITTTSRYRGCGRMSETRRKRKRDGSQIKVVKLVFGWRLIALIDLTTLIPLAIKIVQIQEHEAPHLLDLLAQAQQNLSPHSRIRTLVLDRAYIDGPTLHKLEQQGIIWYLMAKATMNARQTALALSTEGQPLERVVQVRHGHGRDAVVETVRTVIIPVTGIRTWDAYRPPREEVGRLAFAERPSLNAVVIKEWKNELPDPETGPWALLTNGPVDEPWILVDAYDDRSWIENGLFRNAKQFWTLLRWFPEKTEAGVRAHITFVMLMMAAATAYRLWDKAQEEEEEAPVAPVHLARPTPPPKPGGKPAATPRLSHALLGGQGAQRWRQELRSKNRDKLIVFVGDVYGIYDTHEVMVLMRVPLRQLPPHLGTPEEVLRRYDCLPPPDADSNGKVQLSEQDSIP
jgi:hypothetical protein